MRFPINSPSLVRRLRRLLKLLAQVEPEQEDGDVRWPGPFFIPRPGRWWPTRFLRYQSELYCFVEMGWSTVSLVWNVNANEVAFEGEPSFDAGHRHGPELWDNVLRQIEPRLRGALANPEAYNRRVARLLPIGCRTGRVKRRLTWPRTTRSLLPFATLERFRRALARGRRARSWRRLSLRRYLDVAALAYDSTFADLKRLTPLEKYTRRADQRHGGMLRLDPEDPQAFERWYASRDWLGAHPWEIVFAHPHGVLLSPHLNRRTWRFFLSVDTLGLYADTARMAIALGESDLPFELLREQEIGAVLRGEDWVEVGPFHSQLDVDELERRRPGASALVVWDPVPRLSRSRADPSG